MQRTNTITSNRWDETICCQLIQQGRDFLIRISGGTHTQHHHIGAVSTAYYTKIAESAQAANHTNTGDESVQIYTMTHIVPGHKEAVLSEPMAKEAANVFRTTVTVIAGIHYDNLQKHEIDQVIAAAWRVFRATLFHAQ